MFKPQLVENIAKRMGTTKVVSETFLEAFIDEVAETIKNGEDVTLIGFGNFKITKSKPRVARNPRTGQQVIVPEGKKIKFVAGVKIKEAIGKFKK